VKRLLGFALGALVSVGAATSAWAAGNVPAQRGSDQAIEVIVVKAKRLPRDVIDEVGVTVKRPALRVEARTPPAMPIEMPRLEFAGDVSPVVRF
jgi:hypothetical protein